MFDFPVLAPGGRGGPSLKASDLPSRAMWYELFSLGDGRIGNTTSRQVAIHLAVHVAAGWNRETRRMLARVMVMYFGGPGSARSWLLNRVGY